MPDTPLQPFSPPASLAEYFSYINSSGAASWIFYAVFFFWAVYTAIAVYHWIKYSHASLIAVPAIALHVFVSASLFLYILV